MPLLPHGTIGAAFEAAATRYADNPFLIVPSSAGYDDMPDGWQITYGEALDEVERLANAYRDAGYGHGHRVALLLDNRPEHFLHKLALNRLGASVAPVNPDYRANEFAYLVDHCRPALIFALPRHRELLDRTLEQAEHRPPVVHPDDFADALPEPPRDPVVQGPPTPETEASLLYTSGTTGRPKGCILSHDYEMAMGDWYAASGGVAKFEDGGDRVFNPLPLYHVNAGVLSFFGVISRGNAQIVPDRFHPSTFWDDVRETEATVIHALGVVASMLMKREPSDGDRDHAVRFAMSAGIEPTLHAKAEERFGFPFVEIWGMTEACRVLRATHEPRGVGERAIGRPETGLEVRVVADTGEDVPTGEPGEMVIRYSEETPRKHHFSGYLHDPEATEHAWRGGWFHTGDTVRQDQRGMVHFIDRQKNIVRRSGENISAAEVEATLLDHEAVAQVAVTAVDDDIREEEVLACIVPADGHDPTRSLAEEIQAFAAGRLAYFKPPGWILFLDDLPKTGTQKVQKHRLFGPDDDPRTRDDIHDLRELKKRD